MKNNLQELLKRHKEKDVMEVGEWKSVKKSDGLYIFYNTKIGEQYHMFITTRDDELRISKYCPVIPIVETIREVCPNYVFKGRYYEQNLNTYIVCIKDEYVRDAQVFTGDAERSSVDIMNQEFDEDWVDFSANFFLGICKAVSHADAKLIALQTYPYLSDKSLEVTKVSSV